MEELNSETMILLLSVLISNCNFYNSTVCEDRAINIYHRPSVMCRIWFGVNNVIINKRIANYIIHTSEVEHKAIMELLNRKEEDNKLKSFSNDELK